MALCLPHFLIPRGHATKLDLSADVAIKAANYGHLVYNNERNSQALYTENATLGFVIKDIRLEKTPDSIMEVGIVLQSVGAGTSSNTATAPQFADAANRLPHSNGTPYIREAYVKIHKFLKPNVTATFGRQNFTLGQGITLASDNLGLPGGRVEIDNVYRGIKTDLFFFRPSNNFTYTQIYGGAVFYPGREGRWELYHFWQQDTGAGNDLANFNIASKTKKFTGLRYMLTHKQFGFDGETVIQRGTADKTAGGSADYKAHAFMMNGSWAQNIGFFGRSKVRLGYGRSSGNPGTDPAMDKAFFPAFGKKHNGIERSGYGAIAGASLYDIIKTSPTANGLPDGVSGLNIIAIGADLTYGKLLLSADIYKFRATSNASGGSLQVASEWDLKATYPLGESLRLTAVYAVFTPLGLYTDSQQAKLFYGAVSAKF
ncbi:MAG: hypothetical protein A2285_09085 [Elusimicrobia bacterium RIFOXYA12_FULL_57_11]|nr:MAG: hypothetical protein A2285_09085 [Elusimicrobia bacterium RIFOXYA12_FULL_57_11]